MSSPRSTHKTDLRYRRLVVKAGTNVLTGGSDHLDHSVIASLASQVARLHDHGAEVIIVSSGAIAAGRSILEGSGPRQDVSFRQALAAIGQSRLMHTYEQFFGSHGVGVAQALLTRRDLSDRVGYLNVRNTLNTLMENGIVPVVNENDVVAIEEIGETVFGDNDTLSALVSNLVDADLLVLLTDTGGLYTADPHRHPNAKLVERVECINGDIEALAGTHHGESGRGGMPTKLEAAKLATASGVAMVICDGTEKDVVLRLASGEHVGTFFAPTATKMESRRRWLLSGISATGGEIQVDHGAATALRSHHRSLLPAGVREVRGSFQRGAVVYVVDDVGEKIACGISNYSAEAITAIKSIRSNHIEEKLGYHYGAEVVHRNNLVLL